MRFNESWFFFSHLLPAAPDSVLIPLEAIKESVLWCLTRFSNQAKHQYDEAVKGRREKKLLVQAWLKIPLGNDGMIYGGVGAGGAQKTHVHIYWLWDNLLPLVWSCLLYKQHWSCPVCPECYPDWEQLSDLAGVGGALRRQQRARLTANLSAFIQLLEYDSEARERERER